jgi:hypothetical protein
MRFANPSNNEAEYEDVLHGMHVAKACGTTCIKIHGDSNLIAQQVMRECDTTCANMIAYCTMYDKLEGNFEGCEVTHIGRESNEEAYNLANIGSKCLPIPPGVFFEEIFERSIKIKPAIDPALATRLGADHSRPSPSSRERRPVQTNRYSYAHRGGLDEAIPSLSDMRRATRRHHPPSTNHAMLQAFHDNPRRAL